MSTSVAAILPDLARRRYRPASGTSAFLAVLLFSGLSLGACATSNGGGVSVSTPTVDYGAFSDSTDLAAVSAEYRIGPDDLVEVSVYGAPDLSRTMRVSDRGEVVLPLIGSIRVEGSTVHEVEAEVADRLRGRYMHNPEVSVQVKEVRTWSVYVLGEVNRPGTFPVAASRPITVLQAVALGQGFAPMADRSAAYIIRTGPTGERFHIPVDLTQVLDGRTPDVALQPNDVVFVPTNTVKSVGRGILDALLRVVTFRTIL